MTTNARETQLGRWWTDMPEGKLELIDGKLVISTLAGSRWILRELLKDYGPDLVLPMASPALWWTALQQAYHPQPRPAALAEWHEWADGFSYEPEVAPAGPRGSPVMATASRRAGKNSRRLSSGGFYCGSPAGSAPQA